MINLKKNQCHNCGLVSLDEKVGLSSCGSCKSAFYCNKDCQRNHWKQSHSLYCGASISESNKSLFMGPGKEDIFSSKRSKDPSFSVFAREREKEENKYLPKKDNKKFSSVMKNEFFNFEIRFPQSEQELKDYYDLVAPIKEKVDSMKQEITEISVEIINVKTIEDVEKIASLEKHVRDLNSRSLGLQHLIYELLYQKLGFSDEIISKLKDIYRETFILTDQQTVAKYTTKEKYIQNMQKMKELNDLYRKILISHVPGMTPYKFMLWEIENVTGPQLVRRAALLVDEIIAQMKEDGEECINCQEVGAKDQPATFYELISTELKNVAGRVGGRGYVFEKEQDESYDDTEVPKGRPPTMEEYVKTQGKGMLETLRDCLRADRTGNYSGEVPRIPATEMEKKQTKNYLINLARVKKSAGFINDAFFRLVEFSAGIAAKFEPWNQTLLFRAASAILTTQRVEFSFRHLQSLAPKSREDDMIEIAKRIDNRSDFSLSVANKTLDEDEKLLPVVEKLIRDIDNDKTTSNDQKALEKAFALNRLKKQLQTQDPVLDEKIEEYLKLSGATKETYIKKQQQESYELIQKAKEKCPRLFPDGEKSFNTDSLNPDDHVYCLAGDLEDTVKKFMERETEDLKIAELNKWTFNNMYASLAPLLDLSSREDQRNEVLAFLENFDKAINDPSEDGGFDANNPLAYKEKVDSFLKEGGSAFLDNLMYGYLGKEREKDEVFGVMRDVLRANLEMKVNMSGDAVIKYFENEENKIGGYLEDVKKRIEASKKKINTAKENLDAALDKIPSLGNVDIKEVFMNFKREAISFLADPLYDNEEQFEEKVLEVFHEQTGLIKNPRGEKEHDKNASIKQDWETRTPNFGEIERREATKTTLQSIRDNARNAVYIEQSNDKLKEMANTITTLLNEKEIVALSLKESTRLRAQLSKENLASFRNMGKNTRDTVVGMTYSMFKSIFEMYPGGKALLDSIPYTGQRFGWKVVDNMLSHCSEVKMSEQYMDARDEFLQASLAEKKKELSNELQETEANIFDQTFRSITNVISVITTFAEMHSNLFLAGRLSFDIVFQVFQLVAPKKSAQFRKSLGESVARVLYVFDPKRIKDENRAEEEAARVRAEFGNVNNTVFKVRSKMERSAYNFLLSHDQGLGNDLLKYDATKRAYHFAYTVNASMTAIAAIVRIGKMFTREDFNSSTFGILTMYGTDFFTVLKSVVQLSTFGFALKYYSSGRLEQMDCLIAKDKYINLFFDKALHTLIFTQQNLFNSTVKLSLIKIGASVLTGYFSDKVLNYSEMVKEKFKRFISRIATLKNISWYIIPIATILAGNGLISNTAVNISARMLGGVVDELRENRGSFLKEFDNLVPVITAGVAARYAIDAYTTAFKTIPQLVEEELFRRSSNDFLINFTDKQIQEAENNSDSTLIAYFPPGGLSGGEFNF